MTTTAATKFYGSPKLRARQQQRARVDAGGTLEWLPQETILFDGARADLSTRIELQGDARFVGWEIMALGRPVSSLPFDSGDCDQRFEVFRDRHPLWIDRGRIVGGSHKLAAAWGLAGFSVLGSMVWVGVGKREVAAGREIGHLTGEGDRLSAREAERLADGIGGLALHEAGLTSDAMIRMLEKLAGDVGERFKRPIERRIAILHAQIASR